MTTSTDRPVWLRPWTMLGGFAATMIILALLGRKVAHDGFHTDFVRFHPMIAPDSSYRPTMAEMQGVVRQNARPDQVLVVIAGNSVLLGVGQPVGAVWSQLLQELLGPEYAVVNLAFRGSTPTSGGTLVAESLREEYPRQIVLANLGVTEYLNPFDAGAYRFITYDAHYKGMLVPWAPRDEKIKQASALSEEKLAARIDAWLYQNELWNWWSTRVVFTFPERLRPEIRDAFIPRGKIPDRENDYDDFPFAERFGPQFEERNLEIAAARSSAFYQTKTEGAWTLTEEHYAGYLAAAANGIPDQFKARTLLLIGQDAPYYTAKLPADIQQRDALATAQALVGLESVGYSALAYGDDFMMTDYGDRTHLTKSGGARLAKLVAPKVKALAAELGYLPATP